MAGRSTKERSGQHTPVLLTTVLELLKPQPGESVLDVTLGLGGHSDAFLDHTSPNGKLIGLDADQNNLTSASDRLKKYGDRFHPVHANFRELPDCLPEDHSHFDIIFGDLGLSSPHLDDATRGFSFHNDVTLDMRFDQSKGMTASELLMTAPDEDLTFIFQEYGELPKTHRFVDMILESRKNQPIASASDFNLLIDALYGRAARDVLPQIYQALRIAVNDEIGALKHFLSVAFDLLKPGGRMGIISYHSLEDRLVKQTFRDRVTAEKDPVTGRILAAPGYALLTKKPLLPEQKELEDNPRSRSAKLRAIQKV